MRDSITVLFGTFSICFERQAVLFISFSRAGGALHLAPPRDIVARSWARSHFAIGLQASLRRWFNAHFAFTQTKGHAQVRSP